MLDTDDLSALIGSRICHDLISPLGAICNGVELLSMSGITAAPEIALIAESIESANARVRFFRIAFGAANTSSQIGASEIKSILSDMFRGGRIRIDWAVRADLPRPDVKLAFLVIQCLESVLPFGGAIHVSQTGDRWHLSATSDRMKVEPDLWDIVAGRKSGAGISPADVHFALVPETARRIGKQVTPIIRDGSVTVSF